MNLQRPAYRSRLYRDFKSLEAGSPHSLIRFFEGAEADIRQLEDEEFFELLHAYANALFRAGAYAKYKTVADELIACCLDRDLGDKLFLEAIFCKAASCYQLMEYEQAAHLFRELIRIDPSFAEARRGLQRTLYRIKSDRLLTARAASILVLMAAALVTAVELLAVRYFLPEWTWAVEWLRIGLFAAGVLILAGSDLYQRRKAWLEARRFWLEMEKRKK